MGNGVVVSIHQPNYLPWIGYFYKIVHSDIFVLGDNVQFSNKSFINRNRIKTPQGAKWLTVPVIHQYPNLINEVKIDNRFNWKKDHLRTLEVNYKKATYFLDFFERIKYAYSSREWTELSEFNISLINEILSYLKVNKKIIKASELNVEGKGTDLIINIVDKVNGNTYLSGFGGKKYQDEQLFENRKIKLIYYNFIHPIYNQLWGDFIHECSIIDLIFNHGPDSVKFLSCFDKKQT